MRVCVTGGAGFIGSHVCDLLVERGDTVVAVDRLLSQVHPDRERPAYLHHAVELVPLRCRNLAPEWLRSFDAVIHLAARVGVGQSMERPVDYIADNVSETAHLVSALDGQKLVVASSMSVYGEGSREHGVPESWPQRPRSVYASTKQAAEQVATQLYDCTALRFFNVYGPRQQLENPYTGLGAIFTRQIRNGIRPTIFEDGLQTRDFIHVSDVARATVMALDAPTDAYNVATGTPTSVIAFAKLLCAANGSELEPELTGHTRKGDVRHCWGDPSHARRSFDFTAEVSLEQGIEAFVELA